MASVQQILRNEDKVVVEQMIKEAESVLTSESNKLESAEVLIAGCLLNITKETRLQFHKKYDWSGQVSVRVTYPPENPIGGTAKFVHNGAPPKGSKGAIVYATFDTAWLLAWSVPLDHKTHNKVYVEIGRKENFDVIDWNEIERKLDASSDTSFYEDQSTGNKATAKISDGKNAKLGAMFLN